MKKIIKKITAMAVMSLFAATQLQTPQVNVQAESLLMRNQERFCMQRR